MDRMRRIELLVRAAEAGSFSKAARSLQLDRSAVSHAIAELERELKTTLFYRTTRQLRLTEEGEEIYRRGCNVLRELSELESAASKVPERLTGTLRVGMGVPVSRHIIMPRLLEFLRRHRCLVHKLPFMNLPGDEWEFERNGERKLVKVPRTLMTDDREGLIAAALAGSGLMRTGMFDPALITSGRLRKVLNDWTYPNAPTLYAIYRKTARMPPKIAAFLQFVTEAFAAFDPEELTLIHSTNLGDSLPRAQRSEERR